MFNKESNLLWTKIKQIPNTSLLVSIATSGSSANLEIADVAPHEKTRKIYAFEEILGCKFLYIFV